MYTVDMNLLELLDAVKDEKLPKEMIEKYRDTMIHLHTQMQFEMADLEKKEALYFVKFRLDSDVATKREWRITTEGQRMILLNRYIKAIVKEIDSLKSRIYSLL